MKKKRSSLVQEINDLGLFGAFCFDQEVDGPVLSPEDEGGDGLSLDQLVFAVGMVGFSLPVITATNGGFDEGDVWELGRNASDDGISNAAIATPTVPLSVVVAADEKKEGLLKGRQDSVESGGVRNR
eukprot:CAMPEP_0184351974 /NCGR_PEP_ID=MMETSP1089-20130417/57423_1 /TAXON_ID=38269 ORGANISM="Gloeochaete wittrockiana, Strain SAG46.84" /NCGR_SAMPLE_ID=MMETSP1089 /ASSEMBLY_ACC=CAM_ASM_000445 /LENGTH=126 /DNA_ID=CAMNT_0026685903 /DNA_START=15 /DNA_END=392 /DNA_ORIENTATION=-